jgi:hypothetical protein
VDQQVGIVNLTDGTSRPVYEDGHGRQYVLDDLGEPPATLPVAASRAAGRRRAHLLFADMALIERRDDCKFAVVQERGGAPT